MNITKIRQDFPILSKGGIYFDNACQSLRPQTVIDSVTSYYTDYSACAGRSGHHLAEIVNHKYDGARQIVSNFLNANKKEEIVFTRNTTEGINLVANSLDFKKGDVVITGDKEHNSNLIVWQILQEKLGIKHIVIKSKENNTFDLGEYKKALNNNKVKLVSFAITSNLDGVSIPVKDIVELAHESEALVLFDGAQAISHQKVDVKDLDIDFLAFSGHKVLGPSGTGVLYGKYKLLEKLNPFMVGGDTVLSSTYKSHIFLPSPEKFEAGLQDYAGIIGLGEAIKYLEEIGFDEIKKQEELLNTHITNELSLISNLTIIGPQEPKDRGGIISFYIPNRDHHQIALMLDETAKIMVRSGQHCVHSWFVDRNILGSVRASVAFYNTIEETEIFVSELKKVLSVL